MKKRVVYLLAVLCFGLPSSAQKIITGIVKDAHSGERIPFAGVRFQGTNTGGTTDENGQFRYVFHLLPSDSLNVSVLGYASATRALDTRADSQFLNINLDRTGYTIREFVLHGQVDPALWLLHKIIEHKPQNNNDRLDSYKYRVYNKLELDINRVDENKFLHSHFLRPFQFIFRNVDSSSGEFPFLPIFLTESLSDYYFQRSPRKTKEIIYASRSLGIKNVSVSKYLGSMYQYVNVYDNFIPVFDKEFVSPISNFATLYYKYQLVDTQYIDGRKCFHMTFFPKRTMENVFFGDFWVNDTTYAIQKMNLQVSSQANLNFATGVSVIQQYRPLNDTLWFLSKDKFVATFTAPADPKLSLIGRKTTTYRHVIVNDTAATNIFREKQFRDIIRVLPGALDKSDAYWEKHRTEPLSRNEQGVYSMVDSLKKMPRFRKLSNLARFLVTGFKEVGPLEFGPYYSELSANHLENVRLRFDLGTNTKFSKDLYLTGYIAYGTADRKFKGNAQALWIMRRRPRMYLYGSVTHDLDQSNSYYDQFNPDNILTFAVIKPGILQKYVMLDEKRLEYYREGFTGFSQHIELVNSRFSPYAPLPPSQQFPSDGKGGLGMDNTKLGITLRYAYQERFLEGNYYRVSLGSDYPILELKYEQGFRGILNSNYDYQKMSFSISDNISIAPLGSLYYNFFAGKIFGALPFPLLEVPPGNDLLYYDKYAFDMMQRYEFLCDQYAGFNIENELGGGLFNYIPLFRKLKLRQFWTAKGILGNLSQANQALNFSPQSPFKSLQGNPYLELGTGVENIFHFFRVDFIWRITPKLLPKEVYHQNFSVFGSLRFNF